MDYSASSVKYLLWFMETRETVRLRKDHAPEKVREMVIEENIYQQKDRRRIVEEYGCISRRIDAMPEKLCDLLLRADLGTAKLIVLISAMASDRLLLIAGWSESTIKKLKGTYTKFLLEAGLLRKEGGRTKKIVRPFIDQELRQLLLKESMARYLYALTGEQ